MLFLDIDCPNRLSYCWNKNFVFNLEYISVHSAVSCIWKLTNHKMIRNIIKYIFVIEFVDEKYQLVSIVIECQRINL